MKSFILIIVASISFCQLVFAESKRPKLKEVYSTNLDFDEAAVDGQFRAPKGFFIQGRNKKSLTSLLKLRKNFREEIISSRHALKMQKSRGKSGSSE